MAPEPAWLARAKRLQALASTGRHFTDGVHDRERYDEIASIANAMLADLGRVPIERIEALIPDYAACYSTPKVDVRGALIDGDRILLVRERCDDLWSLPGGFADVGITPSRNVEKEMFEEAGLRVRATRLYAIRHKANHPYDLDVRDFYKMFFLCERLDDAEPATGSETSEVGYFRLDALPPLSTGRVLPADLEAAFAFAADPGKAPLVD